MKTKYFSYNIILLFVYLFFIGSCREDSVDIPTYGGEDTSFESADASLAGLFKAIWMAMNCNYPIWDYEQEKYGVDWDAVYHDYLPKFEALDQKYCKNGEYEKSIELNDTVIKLYREIFGQLHDGHTYLLINHSKTGVSTGNPLTGPLYPIFPVVDRNEKERKDYNNPITSTYYYFNLPDHADNKIESRINDISDDSNNSINKIEYCKFKDNILLLRVLSFDFYEKIESETQNPLRSWFEDVQQLHKNGNLRGIIIDLRNNPGGDSKNYRYVMGALKASDREIEIKLANEKTIGTKKIGYLRQKKGVGRLDYSPLVPFYVPVFEMEHASINKEPIVILTNSKTASCSELSCIRSNDMANVCIIGTRTGGAFGSLLDQVTKTEEGKYENIYDYAKIYAGIVGQKYGTFYINIPYFAFLTPEKEIIEGIGIEPDIHVDLDVEEYRRTHRDSQLERALQFIRTGK